MYNMQCHWQRHDIRHVLSISDILYDTHAKYDYDGWLAMNLEVSSDSLNHSKC